MNKDKLMAIKICVLIGGAISLTIYGITYPLDWLAHQGLRTVDECNQLQGTMKDDVNNTDWVKEFPDKANELRKDNCLDGLKYLDNNLTMIRLGLVPMSGITAGLFSYAIFKPDNEQQNNKGVPQ